MLWNCECCYSDLTASTMESGEEGKMASMGGGRGLYRHLGRE